MPVKGIPRAIRVRRRTGPSSMGRGDMPQRPSRDPLRRRWQGFNRSLSLPRVEIEPANANLSREARSDPSVGLVYYSACHIRRHDRTQTFKKVRLVQILLVEDITMSLGMTKAYKHVNLFSIIEM